jgi:cytochrome c oxidase subunit 1
MSTAPVEPHIEAREHYLNVRYGLKSWLLTTDHKRIGVLYLVSITLLFFVGGAFAVLMRLNLLTPAGELVTAETYNKSCSPCTA